MRHTRAGVLMSMYLDERLDSQGTRQLEVHLGECAACRRDMARLRLAEPALREADLAAVTQVPADLVERIAQRVAAYEAQRAADLAAARQRRAAQVAFWSGPGWRLVAVVSALVVAVGVWWRTYPESGLVGAVTRLVPGVLQLLATPGPDEIAWSVWIAGAALALAAGGWLARAEASAEWRRALAERLSRVW